MMKREMMNTIPKIRPGNGRTITMGQMPASKSRTPTAVPMIIETKQIIDSPIAETTMNARVRSSRFERMGVSFATLQEYG